MRAQSALWVGAFMLLMLSPSAASCGNLTSQYTSVKKGACRQPEKSVVEAYDDRGLNVEECSAPKPWRLFATYSDERSWFEVSRDGTAWSPEEKVAYDHPFGDFPNIGAEKVEWLLNKAGTPVALVFRISAMDPKKPESYRKISRLFVVRLDKEPPALCGIAKTNEEARALAEKPQKCTTSLPVRPLALP